MSSATNDGTGQAAYRPTSLDFINLPNPIEPYAGSQRHPLNGTPRLEKARIESNASQDLFKLILEHGDERPVKRQKQADNIHLDLPKLPVRSGPKRPRIPPTLSGLHQPPPDAGLLPSISVDKPHTPPPRPQEAPTPTSSQTQQIVDGSEAIPSQNLDITSAQAPVVKPEKKRIQRNKWSDAETDCLLKGVARFGIGNWTKILNYSDYTFSRRTALDLKDRFRVICPNQYKKSTVQSAESQKKDISKQRQDLQRDDMSPPVDRVSSSKLRELGIEEPFVKTGRRSRHGYTAAEDEALLKGFRKYGNQWAQIRQDAELALSGRKATDLRDRFRTRYPDEYSKAGLISKVDKHTTLPRQIAEATSDTAAPPESDIVTKAPEVSAPRTVPASVAPAMPPIVNKAEGTVLKRSQQPSLFSLDDVFLNAPFGSEGEEAESEPIILDRGILDWASADSNKTNSAEPAKNSGIDPRMTLKLPKPHSSLQTSTSVVQQPVSTTNSTSLPSLATILPDGIVSEQFELPSLMTWLGPMEAEGRTGGNTYPSLDELMW